MKIFLLLLCATFTTVKSNESKSLQENFEKCLKDSGISGYIKPEGPTIQQYNQLNFQQNTATPRKYPLGYLIPNSAKQIQSIVKCGRKLDVSIVPRNGGHGYLDQSFGVRNETVVIIMRDLNSITVYKSGQIGVVEAGALQGKVIYRLFRDGKYVFPYGDAASVGIAGYTLGGGHSRLSTLYGMGCDSVTEMEIVDANGALLTVNNRTHEDLFWALRGSGGGSFGIVTKINYKLYSAPEQVVVADMNYEFDKFPLAFEAWQSLLLEVPNSIQSSFGVDKGKVFVAFLDFQYRSDAHGVGSQRIDKIVERFPVPMSSKSVSVMSYEDWLVSSTITVRGGESGYIKQVTQIKFLSDLDKVTQYGQGSEYFKAKSAFVSKKLSRNEIHQLHKLVNEIKGEQLTFEGHGGKINQIDPSFNAFVHRDSLYLFEIYFIRPKENEPEAWARVNKVFEETKDLLGHKSSYQNYLDGELPDYLQRYYGQNLEKLIKIKQKYDPDNFFYHSQSIRTDSKNSEFSVIKKESIKFMCMITLFMLSFY